MNRPTSADSGFLKNLFDAIPSPVFVVDSDMRIIYFNAAASGILHETSAQILMKKGGDALDCVNARKSPEGCGRSEACKDCVLRNAVYEAIGGDRVFRRKTRMNVQAENGVNEVHFLITTSPFRYENADYALLILEDISELMQLKSMIPICAWCKKIRNDDDYWQSVEEYFSTQVDVDFTHGMCEECYTKEYGDLKRSKKK